MARYNSLPPWPVLRTIILFFFALAGIGWEIIAEQSDRPTLLILLAAMAGLPVFTNVLDDKVYSPRTKANTLPDPEGTELPRQAPKHRREQSSDEYPSS